MGIVNVTPDSFSDGGEAYSLDGAVERALKLEREGADILDIGGESTRPGSDPVPLEEEMRRVVPVISVLRNKVSIPISIDTYKSDVAEAALESGAHIVNDISGGSFDKNMSRMVSKYGAGTVLMHIKGTPRDMQENPDYHDLIPEITSFLETAVKSFIEAGVSHDSIVVDPGIGFGKKLHHNLELLRQSETLKRFAAGVLVGPSRKSFLGVITGAEVSQRLPETISASVTAAILGADIIRVHDVKPIIKALKVADAIKSYNTSAH